ncbi:MAG: orotidine-5'-phosphate decarboxylase [bacterium]|nr:orotidine-5'-phosphate decarboxylase [bacterium]
MKAQDRIVVALDVHDPQAAIDLALQLKGQVGGFKVGFELIYAFLALMLRAGTEGAWALAKLQELFGTIGNEAFLDVKFKDIKNTVAKAVSAIARVKPKMLNVHCDGGFPMMVAAKEALRDFPETKILGVTVLTSLSYEDMEQMGLMPTQPAILYPEQRHQKTRRQMEYRVVTLARLAQQAGLDGVIASPKETVQIRAACGPDFIIGTPGVRLEGGDEGDQARVDTPGKAVLSGADFVVVGRPITEYPREKGGPVEGARLIAKDIEKAVGQAATV